MPSNCGRYNLAVSFDGNLQTFRLHNWLNKTTDTDQVFALLNNQAYEQVRATAVSDWTTIHYTIMYLAFTLIEQRALELRNFILAR
jgi:hypothetical protein